MKRTLALLVAVSTAAVVAPPALAAAKAPKPQTKTLYFHGTDQVGLSEAFQTSALLPMDATKPSGASDKQYPFFGLLATPNSACAGTPFFPNWVGTVRGDLVGKVVVTFYVQSSPGSVRVQLFDNGSTTQCDSDTGGQNFPDPLGEATVTAPTKETPTLVTAVIPLPKKATVHGALNVQIQPQSTAGLPGPQVANVAYDSTTSPSSVTFTCVPKAGKKSC